MRVLLVVNAAASSVTARRRVLVRKALSRGNDVILVQTERRGHATALARAAVRNGTECVVVLGGDGTLNEVASAVSGTSCALAALPGGSTNVFARTLGLPEDPVRAAEVTAASLAAGSIRPVGIGEVNGRPFMFHTGVGWDAALVAEVERPGPAQALRQPPALHLGRPPHLPPHLRPGPPPLPGLLRSRRPHRRRLLQRGAQQRPVHLRRRAALLHLPGCGHAAPVRGRHPAVDGGAPLPARHVPRPAGPLGPAVGPVGGRAHRRPVGDDAPPDDDAVPGRRRSPGTGRRAPVRTPARRGPPGGAGRVAGHPGPGPGTRGADPQPRPRALRLSPVPGPCGPAGARSSRSRPPPAAPGPGSGRARRRSRC